MDIQTNTHIVKPRKCLVDNQNVQFKKGKLLTRIITEKQKVVVDLPAVFK